MGNNKPVAAPESLPEKNPFVFDRPVNGADLFVRPEMALSWVSVNLGNSASTFLTIDGSPGIGRTTFLKQVEKVAHFQDIFPVYVNLKEVPLDSFSEFLWVFGKSIVGSLADSGLSAPPLEKRMLVLRPWQAFHQFFWRQLIEDLDGRRLLLILDDFERLANKSTSSETYRAYRQYLYELIGESEDVFALTSFAGRLETYDPMEIAPFHQSLNFRIAPFSEDQTIDLIHQNRVLDVQQAIASYIHSLTRGHPADIQRLCHGLFERMHNFNFRVVTAADIVSTLRTELRPADFRKPIHYRRVKISYPGK